MALNSRISFRQRELQIDLDDRDLDASIVSGTETFAKCAFCSQFQPGSADETPLKGFLEESLGEAPGTDRMSKFRRLFFESHALCLQELRQKVERTEHTETKILPLPEKVERVNLVKQKLAGLLVTPALEPSHQLIDRTNSTTKSPSGI